MIIRAIAVVLVLGLVGFQQGEEARGAVDELTLEQQVGQLHRAELLRDDGA